MRTPKQIAASRANCARSKGPVTPAGKRNSFRNSTRHGMFADTLMPQGADSSEGIDAAVRAAYRTTLAS